MAPAEEDPRVAVIPTDAWVDTGVVVALKVADVRPTLTVTVAGTVTMALLSVRDTTVPLLGAGPLRVTVPTEVFPPATVAGAIASEETWGGLTVRDAPNEALYVAEIFTPVAMATARVVTLKVAVLVPPGIVTEAGTVATLLLLVDKATMPPARGARPLRVTVPVTTLPPVTELEESVRD